MLRELTALTLTLVGLAGPALAGDRKVLPGHACQPVSSRYVYELSGFKVWNGSTSTQDWLCPVPKDTANDFTGSVTVVDRSAYYTLNCTLYSHSRIGDIIGTSTRYSGAGSQTAPQTLAPFAALGGVTHGYAYIRCSLPASTGIVSYEIDEY